LPQPPLFLPLLKPSCTEFHRFTTHNRYSFQKPSFRTTMHLHMRLQLKSGRGFVCQRRRRQGPARPKKRRVASGRDEARLEPRQWSPFWRPNALDSVDTLEDHRSSGPADAASKTHPPRGKKRSRFNARLLYRVNHGGVHSAWAAPAWTATCHSTSRIESPGAAATPSTR
jgi:hypothetical protein